MEFGLRKMKESVGLHNIELNTSLLGYVAGVIYRVSNSELQGQLFSIGSVILSSRGYDLR